MKIHSISRLSIAANDGGVAGDWVREARSLVVQNQPDLALEKFRAALDADPNNIDARLGAGLVLAHLGREREAAQYLTQVVDRDPHSVRAHLGLGDIEATQKNPAAALAHYAQAVGVAQQVGRPSLAGHEGCARMLLQLGQREEAMGHLNRVLDLDTHHLEALMLKGHTLRWLNRTQEALDVFEQAIDLAPNHHTARAGHRAVTREMGGWVHYGEGWGLD